MYLYYDYQFSVSFPFIHHQVRRLAPLHWHAAGCTALAWGQGGCLLSGGHEGVLLVWRLQTQGGSGGSGGAAGKPAFLPRLGGTVLHLALSPDHTAATVSTACEGGGGMTKSPCWFVRRCWF